MDPLQYMQSLAELWGRGGSAMLNAQQKMLRAMADRVRPAGEAQTTQESLRIDGASWQGLNASAETVAKLWSSALEMSAKVSQAAKGDRAVDPLLQEMLGKVLDPRAWFSASNDLSQSLDRFAEGPRLADLWENERRFLTIFNAWLALRKASLDHNALLLDGWMQAAGAFAKQLNEKADKGETLESWRQVLALWVEIANDAMLNMQRTDGFLKSQRELLSAASELRLAQKELAQYYSEMFGFPTRDELDDVHKTVTELRRELRALKRDREERGLQTGGAAGVPRPRAAQKKPANRS